jgi:hypothetical protein
MANTSAPFALGSKGLTAYNTVYSVNLGRTYVVDGRVLKLIKTSAALASCAKQVAVDSGTTTNNNTVAAVSAAANHRFLGLFHTSQVDLASGDFALVIAAGVATAICGAATTAGNALITAATGRLTNDGGAYTAATMAQGVAVALQTQTTGNDVAVQVLYRA